MAANYRFHMENYQIHEIVQPETTNTLEDQDHSCAIPRQTSVIEQTVGTANSELSDNPRVPLLYQTYLGNKHKCVSVRLGSHIFNSTHYFTSEGSSLLISYILLVFRHITSLLYLPPTNTFELNGKKSIALCLFYSERLIQG